MRKGPAVLTILFAGCAPAGEDSACVGCVDMGEQAETDAAGQLDPHADCVFDSEHEPFWSALRETPFADDLEFERTCADPVEWTAEPLVFVDGEQTPFSDLIADGVVAGQLVTLAFAIPGDDVCRSSAFNPTYTVSLPGDGRANSVSDGYWLVGKRTTDYWAVMEVDTFATCQGSYTLNIANTPFTFSAVP